MSVWTEFTDLVYGLSFVGLNGELGTFGCAGFLIGYRLRKFFRVYGVFRKNNVNLKVKKQ